MKWIVEYLKDAGTEECRLISEEYEIKLLAIARLGHLRRRGTEAFLGWTNEGSKVT